MLPIFALEDFEIAATKALSKLRKAMREAGFPIFYPLRGHAPDGGYRRDWYRSLPYPERQGALRK